MENYLYVRTGGASATEDDDLTGSTVYPVSAFRGMCSGTSDETGTVTDDDNALSLFFTPKGVISTDADGASELDVIVLACAQYGQKAVMQNLTAAMAAPYSGKFITLFDGYADKPAIDPTTDIVGVTGSTVIHAHQ
jgi:hypothetical protein